MTENMIFTLCRMITWIVFLRMFWNFISSLAVKRGGSLSFLVRTISNVLVMEIGWTDVGGGGYILVSCAHSNTSLIYDINCTALGISCRHYNKILFLSFYKRLWVSARVKYYSYPYINGYGYLRELNTIPILLVMAIGIWESQMLSLSFYKWLWVSERVKCYSYPSINVYRYLRESNAIPILL